MGRKSIDRKRTLVPMIYCPKETPRESRIAAVSARFAPAAFCGSLSRFLVHIPRLPLNATSPIRYGSADLRVAVLHNYGDERQPSMRLYAERLGDALLRQGVAVTRLQAAPRSSPRAGEAARRRGAKLDIQFGRFAVYPRLVRNVHADIIHVIDHGQAYLLNSLDPERTVVTCHDIILLALAHGRIGSLPVPPIALQILNLSLEPHEARRGHRRGLGADQARPHVVHRLARSSHHRDRASGSTSRSRPIPSAA